MPSLFTGLNDDDKLKKLLQSLNSGASVQIGDPRYDVPPVNTAGTGEGQEEGASHALPTRDDLLRQRAAAQAASPQGEPAPAVADPTSTMFSAYGGADQTGMPISGADTSYQNTPLAAPAPSTPQPTWKQPFAMPAPGTSVDKLNEQIQQLQNGNYQDPHHHSALGRLFKGLAKGYQQWNGQGGLLGLAASSLGAGVGSAASPEIYADLEKKGIENKLFQRLGQQEAIGKYDSDQAYRQAQMQQMQAMGNYRTGQLQSIDDYRQGQLGVKQDANEIQRQRVANQDKHVIMRTVSGMIEKNPGSFDPDSTEGQEMQDYLKHNGIDMPLLSKDAKKTVKVEHDEKSGEWRALVTDPTTGQTEVRPFLDTDTGKPISTTSTAQLGAQTKEDVADKNNSTRVKTTEMRTNQSAANNSANNATRRDINLGKTTEQRAMVLAKIDAMPPNKGETPEQTQARKDDMRKKYLAALGQ